MNALHRVPLGELTTLISSGSTPKGGASTYLDKGPVLFIRSQNVRMNQLALDDVAYVTEDVHHAMKRTHVEKGDVLLNITGASIGRVAPFFLERTLANVNQHVCIIRPKAKQLDSQYLSYFISSARFQAEIARQQHGGTRQALTFQQIGRFGIPLPPLSEQRRIAAILDKADTIRRKRQQTIRLTEDLLRSTFLEIFGDPVTNPKAWPTALLGAVADIGSGVTKGRNLQGKQTTSVPYMRVANVQDGRIDLTEVKNISVLPSDVEKYALRLGDILLTEGGDPDKLGRGGIWKGEVSPCIHQNHVFRVRIGEVDSLTPTYLSALIGSERGKRYFLRSAKQTTGIATINKTQLRDFPVLLPPAQLQEKFQRVVDCQERAISSFVDADIQTQKLSHSLMQSAFSGGLS